MKLSYSSVTTYLENPRKFYYKYIAKYREKTIGSALVFGNAVDKGLNILLTTGHADVAEEYAVEELTRYKLNGEVLELANTDKIIYSNGDIDVDVLPESQIEGHKLIVDELLQIKRDKGLNQEQQALFNQIANLCLKEKARLIIRAYKEQIMPHIKEVLYVQHPFTITNDDKDEFIGYIDLKCKWDDGNIKGIVRFDNKTTSKKYEDNSVAESGQLATYDVADDYSADYSGFIAIHKKIRKSKEPRVRIQVIIDNVSQEVIDKTFEDYDRVNMLVKRGEFPANCDSCKINKYNQRCQYYDICFHNDYSNVIIKKD